MNLKHLLFAALALSHFGVRAQVNINPFPTRFMGQLKFNHSGLNLIEGREFWGPQGVALDTSISPPRLYVVDTGNNRVLGWQNAYSFANGAKADIVVGQVDFVTTQYLGPGTTQTSGLHSPVAAAVDRWGNLWVADAGNNRILRYKRPFEQSDQYKTADFVIGQPSLNARTPNNTFGGDLAVNPRGIRLNPNNTTPCSPCLQSAVLFDTSGNLWFSDAGNNRILRFPSESLPGAGDGSVNPDGVYANLQIGQTSFNTNAQAASDAAGPARLKKNQLTLPFGLAFDASGNLWVTDNLARALFFKAPLFSAMTADRLLGIPVAVTGQTLPNINEIGFFSPSGIFFAGGKPYIMDQAAHRILRFETPDKWDAEDINKPVSTAISPAATGVLGQDDFNSGFANRGQTAETNASSFFSPVAAAVAPNGEVFIVDGNNNRVVVLPNPAGGPDKAPIGPPYQFSRVLGQDYMHGAAANLIEGRELSALSTVGTQTTFFGMGIAVDKRSTPPRLYIADTGNNRILCFSDARRVRPGDKADLVIGQVDMTRRLINSPLNDSRRPVDTGLFLPTGVAVDDAGNLWVADWGNGRVLRFPSPFAQAGTQRADLVLGQPNMTTHNTDITARTLAAPYSLAFTAGGNLAVTDYAANRILYFPQPFTSGMAATKVLGQQDFNSSSAGSTLTQLRSPTGIAIDSDDRAYVCDYSNNRVMLFERLPSSLDTGASAGFVLPVSGPFGVDVSQLTGDIWVTERNQNRVLRFPRYNDLLLNPNPNLQFTNTAVPLDVKIDSYENPIFSDGLNRVAFHFPQVTISNSASGFARVAPGMIATTYFQAAGPAVADQNVVNTSATWPKSLNDTRVLVNDTESPLYYVFGTPRQVAFYVPKNAPESGTADVYIEKVSTGQVIGAARVDMGRASPSFFTNNQAGTGQIAALNQDSSRNGPNAPTANPPTKPAKWGEVVQLFLTGQGNFATLPDDGVPASSSGPTPFPVEDLLVVVGSSQAEVQYNGLAPGFVGLWQLNIKVPQNVAGTEPSPPWNVPVVVRWRGAVSNLNPVTAARITTTIAVQP